MGWNYNVLSAGEITPAYSKLSVKTKGEKQVHIDIRISANRLNVSVHKLFIYLMIIWRNRVIIRV